jgi:hypothetical protein
MKARAEHAKLQQEEFERKKSAPAVVPLATQRIKQRANSAINWSSVKQERRKTISEVPKPE